MSRKDNPSLSKTAHSLELSYSAWKFTLTISISWKVSLNHGTDPPLPLCEPKEPKSFLNSKQLAPTLDVCI